MNGAGPRIHRRTEARGGGRIAFLAVDNPGKLNVLDPALAAELLAAIEMLAHDEALRAVVLSGAGERAFIGGADIRAMAGFDKESAAAFITLLHRICAALRGLPVPVIARIRGFALGAGLEIAAACDLRVASTDARFGMPEVKVGIPSVIEAALLPTLIGWGRTRRLLLTGETIDAAEAERWGLVERCVPAAELDAAVEAWLDMILANGPAALRLQKALIAEWESLPLACAIERGIDCFVSAYDGDEPRRMMSDFLAAAARRKPG
jgi:enoyl-CoA hydratase